MLKTIKTQMAEQSVPGLAIAIVQNGEIIFQEGFGYRNIESKDPVTPATLFRIGSTTKPLTVIGLMQLVEAGKLNLDAPVVQYLPEFKVNPKITVRQIISHSSGMADMANPYGRTDAAALKDYVSSFSPQSAFAPPGVVLSYSNPAFNAAGLVIEKVSGMPYTDYMDKFVFPALKMFHSTINSDMAMTYPLAVGYETKQTGLETVRPNPNNAAEYPAGFVFSNVQELANLALFILQDGQLNGKSVLSSSSVQLMKTPVVEVEPIKVSYGLGLIIAEERGASVIGHDGGINGYTSYLKTIPSANLGIVVLANRSGFNAEPIFESIIDSFSKLPKQQTETPPKLDPTALAAYAGEYEVRSADGKIRDTLVVSVKQDKLIVKALSQPEAELRPLSADLFNVFIGDQLVNNISFLRDSTGKITFLSASLRAYSRIK
ncbi:serine hydrolase [Coleofasciculus sp. FACHB-712]|uniref:serine hydrolase domain-containing protein n=1 Tax=Cyanophyceae TaxID=3028117 RepID=UPI0016823180|nr:serine hydrolase domain-containing protein [Coleofasciculus sp. FACHB-712]MBD1945667.1 serine hydrolase [Coleofasciculus sp. FACHB-712]